MKRFISAAAVSLLLAGCASIESPLDDGYQFGDLSATAVELQATYCTEMPPIQRAFLLAGLHSMGADIPPRGACTDLVEMVGQDRLAEIGAAVDVEAAREDRERFQ